MTGEVSNSLPAFGFLTAVEDPQHGFFGGYLILCQRGRPLEFHCSTPVLPSQAQKMLYGATLQPYLFGELIGPTLLEKAQLPVQAVLTDQPQMQALAPSCEQPVAWLHRREDRSEGMPSANLDQPPGPQLDLGNYRLSGTSGCQWQADWLRLALTPLVTHIDLAEPFQRIREAICEAQRVSDHPDEHQHDCSAAA